MSDNHTGIYICLIILIIICAGILAVLIYNAHIQLPPAQDSPSLFDAITEAAGQLTPEQKTVVKYEMIGIGILGVIALSYSVYCWAKPSSNADEKSKEP
jgi:hypothetical protein